MKTGGIISLLVLLAKKWDSQVTIILTNNAINFIEAILVRKLMVARVVKSMLKKVYTFAKSSN